MDKVRPPYYAVIFTSKLAPEGEGYAAATNAMLERVAEMPGYLGVDSARGSDGSGITVSYWASLDSIRGWGMDPTHRKVQERGKAEWYESYRIRIARVEEERP